MKQENLFGAGFDKNLQTKYANKITLPTYEPKNVKPHIGSLVDNKKTRYIINDINDSKLPDDEKRFLIEAASRHTVFNYQNIADYYAHASPEMQALMERQALVIIDFGKAYEYGYVKLAHDIANQYFKTYGE